MTPTRRSAPPRPRANAPTAKTKPTKAKPKPRTPKARIPKGEAARPRRTARRLLVSVLSTTTFLVLVAGVVPVRQYLEQQRRLAVAHQRIELLDEQNRRLAARADELRTDEEVERLAREQYSLVRPGEEAFALLPGSDEKRPAQAPLSSPVPVKAPDSSLLERVLDAIAFWD